MIIQLVIAALLCWLLLEAIASEPAQVGRTHAEEQIEIARKMMQVRFRRINQDRFRREQIEIHQRMRVELAMSLVQMHRASRATVSCMRGYGL